MSERLRERLSGAQIDRQFDSISQGGRIRTTPTPSPRSSKSVGSYIKEARSTTSSKSAMSSLPALPNAGAVQGNEELEDISVTPTPQSPLGTSPEVAAAKPKENRQTKTTRPPPILKNLSVGSDRPSRTPSVLYPAFQASDPIASTGTEAATTVDNNITSAESLNPVAGKSSRKSTTTRFNEEVAVSIPKASTVSRSSSGRLLGESSQRSGRKNPIIVASTGASKRRPAIIRQRSSQVASFGALKDSPSRISSSPNLALSMRSNHSERLESPSQERESSSALRSRAASPHPSKHRKTSSPTSPLSSKGIVEEFSNENAMVQEPSKNPNTGSWVAEGIADTNEISKALVDPDFRSQFVDKTQSSNRSFTNIASFARKSSAAMPTAASFQASGMLDTGQGSFPAGRNRGKEAFKNEVIPLKAPASAGPEPSAEASQPLPRTKSQLTLLLEKEKSRSASRAD